MQKIVKLISKKEAFLYIFCVLSILIQVSFEMAIPKEMAETTYALQNGTNDMEDIMHLGNLMLAFSIGALVAAVCASYSASKAGASLSRHLREKVFSKIMTFSLEETGKYGTASLISRCTTDITTVQDFVTGGLITIIKSPITIVCVVVRMSMDYWQWSAATTSAVILIVAFVVLMLKLAVPVMKRYQEVNDKIIEESTEHITGIRVVHSNKANVFQKKRYEKLNDEATKLLLFGERMVGVFVPFTTAVMNLLVVAIYVLGAVIMNSNDSNARMLIFAEMTEFLSYSILLVSAFVYVILIIANYPTTKACALRINEVLDTRVRITDGEESIIDDAAAGGAIEFSHVSFKYQGAKENALTDISFKVEPGENVAIIGSTGSGKTTLLNLIPRLYDVNEGVVSVCGIDVRKLKINELRNILGYVPQKSMLFMGTIANNISFGINSKYKESLDEIKKAAKIGQADEFISHKEGGYEGTVAYRGSNFSGGQKQRLTISRAIYRDPKIYLFDDSFSALDFKTDSILRKKLRENAQGATVIIVAQRISTIRNADKIIVLDKGRIVGEGTHDFLMNNCEVYKEIAQSQQG